MGAIAGADTRTEAIVIPVPCDGGACFRSDCSRDAAGYCSSDVLSSRGEKDRMRQSSKPPRSWTTVGVVGAMIGLAFWVAVVFVAWHFIAKYW